VATPAIEFRWPTVPVGEAYDCFEADELRRLRASEGAIDVALLRAADGGSELLSLREYEGIDSVPPADGSDREIRQLVGEQLGDTGAAVSTGPHLFLVIFPVPAIDQEEFDAWYREEHVPMLMAHPSWLRCRRYRVAGDKQTTPTRIALHDLADLSVLESPERAAAAETKWRLELAARPWFAGARFDAWDRI
jgi:hypothetical protein